MKLSQTLSLVCLAAALAFAGCKKTDAPPGDPTAVTKAGDTKPADPGAPAAAMTIGSDDAYVTTASAMMDKMVGVITTAGTDCDKLADGLTKMAADNNATMKALTAYEKAHPAAKAKFDAAAKDKTKAFEAAAGPAIEACKNNKHVADAFEKLAG